MKKWIKHIWKPSGLHHSIGERHNLTTGRFNNFPSVVRTVPTRTALSSPGCISTTRAIFQVRGGGVVSFRITSPPIERLRSSLYHLDLIWMVCKLFSLPAFQKCCWIRWMSARLLRSPCFGMVEEGTVGTQVHLQEVPWWESVRQWVVENHSGTKT